MEQFLSVQYDKINKMVNMRNIHQIGKDLECVNDIEIKYTHTTDRTILKFNSETKRNIELDHIRQEIKDGMRLIEIKGALMLTKGPNLKQDAISRRKFAS